MTATDSVRAQSTQAWDSELLSAFYDLAFASPDREVAGVLVGVSAETTLTGLPLARAAIPITQGVALGQAAVFGHETWAHVHATMARHYRGLEVVGWYVSRPGLGVSLTEADIVNHRRWFQRREQILLRVDSRSHRAGVYAWDAAGRLGLLAEGLVYRRRSTRRAPAGFPGAAVALLALLGGVLGTVVFLVTQVIGG